jgi:hypothetical protein
VRPPIQLLSACLHPQRAYTAVPLIKPRRSSSLVGPPSRSCQPPLPLHLYRVCFAAAPRRASPLASRLGTADSCRARPCAAHCQSRCRGCVPTEKLPPRPLRPTLAAADGRRRCDFPFHQQPERLPVWERLLPRPRLSFSVGRHLQAISIFITGCLVLSRLGAPPQNYRRSRRAYSPAPATFSGVRCRSRSAGERAGAPARSCPSGDAVPLRATFSAHSTRLARAVGRRVPGQNGRTCRPRARSSSLQATPTPVAAQPSLQPTALSGQFFTPAYATRWWRSTLHYSPGGG